MKVWEVDWCFQKFTCPCQAQANIIPWEQRSPPSCPPSNTLAPCTHVSSLHSHVAPAAAEPLARGPHTQAPGGSLALQHSSGLQPETCAKPAGCWSAPCFDRAQSLRTLTVFLALIFHGRGMERRHREVSRALPVMSHHQ